MHHVPEWLFLVLIQMKYGNLVLVPVWLHLAWLHIGLPASWESIGARPRVDAQTSKGNQAIVQDHTSLKENAEHPAPQG